MRNELTKFRWLILVVAVLFGLLGYTKYLRMENELVKYSLDSVSAVQMEAGTYTISMNQSGFDGFFEHTTDGDELVTTIDYYDSSNFNLSIYERNNVNNTIEIIPSMENKAIYNKTIIATFTVSEEGDYIIEANNNATSIPGFNYYIGSINTTLYSIITYSIMIGTVLVPITLIVGEIIIIKKKKEIKRSL